MLSHEIMSRWILTVAIAAAALALGSCKGAEGKATAAGASGPSHTVEVKAPPAAQVGTAANVQVAVRPAGGWHINKDFPVSLAITAPPGVELAKTELKGADAARFDEQALDFAIAVTPRQTGAKSFQATLKFAVCTTSSCVPKRESLAWTVNVK